MEGIQNSQGNLEKPEKNGGLRLLYFYTYEKQQ
jgi:hypothetical protein